MNKSQTPTPPAARPLSAEEVSRGIILEIPLLPSRFKGMTETLGVSEAAEQYEHEIAKAIQAYASHVSQPLVEALERANVAIAVALNLRCGCHSSTEPNWHARDCAVPKLREAQKQAESALELFKKGAR